MTNRQLREQLAKGADDGQVQIFFRIKDVIEAAAHWKEHEAERGVPYDNDLTNATTITEVNGLSRVAEIHIAF